ncbi:MAG: phosphoribosylamine--glycine ligase, partial [Actinomycetes bacterium]
MKVLVIGSGGREHALCRTLASDPAVTALACAPGNAGTAVVAESYEVDAGDPAAVAALAGRWGADLVVVGPEAPLVA